ncbi:MAG: hypothetical protein LBJ86_06960 [Spirochaetaceae bacterium]|jgi:hypothetical protein|nr:hypothetical protein [Spirochaetaceae bacterium]
MKKVRATVFLILALGFSFSVFGIDIVNGKAFGISQTARASPSLEVKATGSAEVSSYTVASGVGGVLFQATAVPAGNAVNQPVSVRYDPAREDGQRLVIAIGTSEIVPLLYDWQLIPIARYADSEYNACITLLGQPNYLERLTGDRCNMYLEVHPAFSNTLIGFNLFLIDAMLINPDRVRRIPGALSETVRGYNDGEFNETRSASNARQIDRILSTWKYGYTSYIYTDCEKDITYDVIDGQLVFMGVPVYQFLLLDHVHKTATLNQQLNLSVILIRPLITALNPAVYATAETTAQWAAFFRGVKEQDLSGWNTFIEQIAGIEVEPSIAIPRVWLRDGK